jgi:hypothetical protein
MEMIVWFSGQGVAKMKLRINCLSPVLAFLAACALPAAAMGADKAPAPKSAVSDMTSEPPMVIDNSDGTITVQKEPPIEHTKDGKAKMGLVVPPQIVVPVIQTPKEQ